MDIAIKKVSNPPYDILLLADPSEDAINDYVNRGICYGAYYDGVLTGVYVLLKTRPFIYEIVNIAVYPEYQKRGIGRAMVIDAIQKCKGFNAESIEIGTGNSSINQLLLYQKCGFRIVGVDRDFFKMHYKDTIMENGIRCIDMIRLSMNLE